MRFQVRELLNRAVVLAVALLIHEAEREEIVWTIIVLGIPHDGLLGHTHHVARWNIASIGELEVFKDLALDGYFTVVSFLSQNVMIQSYSNVQESKGSWRAASRRKLSINGRFL